ncbi:MAG: zf-HC2 domain-containing protein [Armatimonadota bacterium]
MSCKHYKNLLVPFAEGTLPEKLTDQVDDHVSTCDECSRELDELTQTMNILGETDYPAMEPAFDLRSRVMARIAEEPVRKPWWSGRLQAYYAAAAGLVFIGICFAAINPVFGPFRQSAQMEDTISASVTMRGSAPSGAVDPKLRDEAVPPVPEVDSGSDAIKSTIVGGLPGAAPTQPANTTHPAVKPGLEAKVGKPAGTRSIPGDTVRMANAGRSPNMEDRMDSVRIYSEKDIEAGVPAPSMPSVGAQGPQSPASIDNKMAYNQMEPGGAPNQSQVQADRFAKSSSSFKNADESAGGFGNARPGNAVPEIKQEAEEGTHSLEQKLTMFPNSITLMNKLLVAYRSAGRSEDEYAIAERLTKADPNNASYWFARAQAAERAKMVKTAVSCYRTAIDRKLSGADLELAKSRLKALGE